MQAAEAEELKKTKKAGKTARRKEAEQAQRRAEEQAAAREAEAEAKRDRELQEAAAIKQERVNKERQDRLRKVGFVRGSQRLACCILSRWTGPYLKQEPPVV